jgi:hypothetical protein
MSLITLVCCLQSGLKHDLGLITAHGCCQAFCDMDLLNYYVSDTTFVEHPTPATSTLSCSAPSTHYPLSLVVETETLRQACEPERAGQSAAPLPIVDVHLSAYKGLIQQQEERVARGDAQQRAVSQRGTLYTPHK